MNGPKSSPPGEGVERIRGAGPLSPGRRRFAKGAAPVVLGSLLSSPVLGAAPYHCTVSGHVSGDASPRADAGKTCELGKSRTYWLGADWDSLSGLAKGDLPNNECQWDEGKGGGTDFNGFARDVVAGGLASAFFFIVGDCEISTSGTDGSPASLYQVLATEQEGELFDLGRATVVSLLNYFDAEPGEYPVTAARIIHMFNSTYYNGGLYKFNATVSWDRKQVVNYLTSLYPVD